MRFSLYLDDYETEKIFSYLRWIFLLVAIIIFYVPRVSASLELNHETFPILLAIGTVYMTFTQIALQKISHNDYYFHWMTKTGILFDFVALIWLMFLSGGMKSPFFAVFFLLIMHATIYWNTKGAFISSLSSFLGYGLLFLLESEKSMELSVIFVTNSVLIWIVGLFGSLLVLRERKHLKQKELYYEQMVTDYLTSLYNHRCFQEELKAKLQSNHPFMIVMGDIDYFKRINDHYGHLAGDEVLAEIGVILKNTTSKYQGEAFRYGGEEFAILLPILTEQQIHELFEELFTRLNSLSLIGCKHTITMSFGLASSLNQPFDEDLVGVADTLLYEAKRSGKNRLITDTNLVYKNELNDQTALLFI